MRQMHNSLSVFPISTPKKGCERIPRRVTESRGRVRSGAQCAHSAGRVAEHVAERVAAWPDTPLFRNWCSFIHKTECRIKIPIKSRLQFARTGTSSRGEARRGATRHCVHSGTGVRTSRQRVWRRNQAKASRGGWKGGRLGTAYGSEGTPGQTSNCQRGKKVRATDLGHAQAAQST